MKPFEVLLISIDWESPNRFRSIIQSQKYLEASEEHGNHSEFDIVLYEKENNQYFQFAIKTKLSPAICDNQRTWKNENLLFNIHEDLWIIKGDWRIGQRGIGYHHCPSVNTIGKIEIGISENLQQIKYHVTIDINSNIEDFDFEELKSDFEGELWNLITSDKSKVSTDKVEIRYSDRTFRYAESKSILDFLSSFDKIEKSPKVELVQTQILQKKEKVIPVKDTFRKLLNPSSSKLLPSKAVKENINVYENQYVCYMLHCIHEIITNNVKFTAKQITRLEYEKKVLGAKIELHENLDPKADKDVLLQEIETLEKYVADEKNKWKEISESLNNIELTQIQTLTLNLVRLDNNNKLCYWCYYNGTRCLVEMPALLIKKVNPGEYTLHATIESGADYELNGQISKKYILTGIRKVWPNSLLKNSKLLSNKKLNYGTLENSNWSQKSLFSQQDMARYDDERESQIYTINNKITKLTAQIDRLNDFNREQSELLPYIIKRMKGTFFQIIESNKIRNFKPSMSFIQNINYRNALTFHSTILKSEGIDISIFDSYENVTNYGIREMPQIYESWCFVTLIKLITENYHFTCSKKDIQSVLNVFNRNKQYISEHIEIDFSNTLAGRKLSLHYQKRIEGNKRPDFILEITANGKSKNIVLDSKFKNYKTRKSIEYDTIKMVKKYRQGGNSVFILHPCKDGIFHGRKISNSNLGSEVMMFDKIESSENQAPNHEYGFIELKPNYTDNLRKLISMGLEYLIEKKHKAIKNGTVKYDPIPENPSFCLSCGGSDINIVTFKRGDSKDRHHYTCTCNNEKCKHTTYIDYCWNCKNKLFKHGSLWDYHKESSWNAYDIHCPDCSMTLADRPLLKTW